MRILFALALAATLAGCHSAPPPPSQPMKEFVSADLHAGFQAPDDWHQDAKANHFQVKSPDEHGVIELQSVAKGTFTLDSYMTTARNSISSYSKGAPSSPQSLTIHGMKALQISSQTEDAKMLVTVAEGKGRFLMMTGAVVDPKQTQMLADIANTLQEKP